MAHFAIASEIPHRIACWTIALEKAARKPGTGPVIAVKRSIWSLLPTRLTAPQPQASALPWPHPSLKKRRSTSRARMPDVMRPRGSIGRGRRGRRGGCRSCTSARAGSRLPSLKLQGIGLRASAAAAPGPAHRQQYHLAVSAKIGGVCRGPDLGPAAQGAKAAGAVRDPEDFSARTVRVSSHAVAMALPSCPGPR